MRTWFLVQAAILAVISSSAAFAHVGFDAPMPQAELVPGSTVEVQWRDVIPHTTVGYDLEWIPAPGVEAVPIVRGIEPGTHYYSWVVPDMPCQECSLRVIQVNDGAPYSSTIPIRIVGDSAPEPDAGIGPEGTASVEPPAANPTALPSTIQPGAPTASTAHASDPSSATPLASSDTMAEPGTSSSCSSSRRRGGPSGGAGFGLALLGLAVARRSRCRVAIAPSARS